MVEKMLDIQGPNTMQQAVVKLHCSIKDALAQERWQAAGEAAYVTILHRTCNTHKSLILFRRYELASACGWRNTNATVQYLCLYQSCAMRGKLLEIVEDA